MPLCQLHIVMTSLRNTSIKTEFNTIQYSSEFFRLFYSYLPPNLASGLIKRWCSGSRATWDGHCVRLVIGNKKNDAVVSVVVLARTNSSVVVVRPHVASGSVPIWQYSWITISWCCTPEEHYKCRTQDINLEIPGLIGGHYSRTVVCRRRRQSLRHAKSMSALQVGLLWLQRPSTI